MKARSQKNTIPDSKILKEFENWYLQNQRRLPWREKPHPYSTWISEIMLQQTQVSKVIPYFNKFMNAFPTVEELSLAPLEKVYLYWAGLGYYSRARNIHEAAKKIVAEFQGTLPENKESLLSLPGVGPYTAGAILSIAFHKEEPLLDGNVERFLSRYFLIEDPKKNQPLFWELSRQFLQAAVKNKISPPVFNQALMEHGALVCTPKKTLCGLCVFQKKCQAFLHNKVEHYPKKKSKKWISIHENVLALLSWDRKKILLTQIPKGQWREGMWDLPSSEQRPLLEKIYKNKFMKSKKILESKHVVTHHKILRRTQVCNLKNKVPLTKNLEPGWVWVSMDELFSENPGRALSSSFVKTWKGLVRDFLR